MIVKTKFEVKHFTEYLNHFPNLKVVSKSFSGNYWKITLNDKSTYQIHMFLWNLIQSNVPRLNEVRSTLQ